LRAGPGCSHDVAVRSRIPAGAVAVPDMRKSIAPIVYNIKEIDVVGAPLAGAHFLDAHRSSFPRSSVGMHPGTLPRPVLLRRSISGSCTSTSSGAGRWSARGARSHAGAWERWHAADLRDGHAVIIVPTLQRGNASRDAPASRFAASEHIWFTHQHCLRCRTQERPGSPFPRGSVGTMSCC